MKNVYFVQAGYTMGDNAYLPYACGCLAAYAWRNPAVASAYRCGGFFFLRDPLDAVLDRMETPGIVAFSCCAWNFEYHKALAAAIKARWPGCATVFGGHQILADSAEQLERCAAADYLVHGAGEIPFERLLLALLRDGGDVSRVPCVSFRLADGTVRRNNAPAPPCPAQELPSPYLSGCFDQLLEEYGGRLVLSAIFETNRGCPNHCAFCDWCGGDRRLRLLSMERVLAEIDWFARRSIEVVFCADSNFGLFPRDEAAADAVIAAKAKYGFPRKFIVTYEKDGGLPLRINEKLHRAGLSAGATLAFQSADPLVLENIGRKNLTFGQYRNIMLRYNQKGIPAYAEFIAGLPGETYGSFTAGIGRVLEGGLCASIEAFPCELLPNAPMADPAYIEAHRLEIKRLRRTQRHQTPPPAGDIPEYADIVVGTASMPREDLVRALLFSDVVQAFHGCRLLSLAAVFLHAARGIALSDFYKALISCAWEHPQTLLGELLPRFHARLAAFSQGEGEQILLCEPLFGDILYPLAESLFLYCAAQAGRFFAELPLFLRRYGLEAALQAELIAWQQRMAVLPEPFPEERRDFQYDWNDFFEGYYTGEPRPLRARPNSLVFSQPAQRYAWPDFAREIVWYRRRTGSLVKKGYEVIYV